MQVKWWLSSNAMTVLVVCEQGKIVEAPAIVRKFIGQPLDNLTIWMHKQGGLRVQEITDDMES